MFDDLRVSAFLAAKSISRGNKGTLVLTIAIIALVFVNLVFLPSIIAGVVQTFNTQSIDFDYGNLVIEPREQDLYISNVQLLQKKLERIPGITGTSPRISTGVTYLYRGRNARSTLYGINPEDERRVTRIYERMVAGEYLSAGDTGAIILGTTLAGQEGEQTGDLPSLRGVQVGDSVEVDYPNGQARVYRVKGIYATQSFGVDLAAFVSAAELEGVLGVQDKTSQILVKTEKNGREDTYKLLVLSYGIQEEVRTYREKAAGFVDQAIQSFNIINLISTVVSLIITVVVIFIVVFINTVNKRRQIGILKAIGINQQIIINSYVLQVIFITTVGASTGLVMNIGVVSYLTAYPLVFPGGPVYPVVELNDILRSIASLFVVSVIAGYIPAWRTVREDILTAIRGQA
ncbi:MAG: FtsX-like permease family protein [Methanomicrobiales archaeon]|nr:FtsX-like permease family protein [Methanomicrobiales archaeon]